MENKETVTSEINEKRKVILVTRELVDTMQPEELISNYDAVKKAIDEKEIQLAGIDAQVKLSKDNMTKDIEVFKLRLEGLEKHLKKARMWAEINKKEAERAGKEQRNSVVSEAINQ